MKIPGEIVETIHRLLPGLGADAIGFLASVERNLAIVGAPDISWAMQSVDTGLFRCLAGRSRHFLSITHAKFEHIVLIAARPYGTVLQVSWLLTASPRLSKEIVRAVRLTSDAKSRHDIGAELDPFALMDLNAFIDITRLAFKQGVAELTEDEEAEDSGTPPDIESVEIT
jgi:hypothetical protein